MTMRNHQPLLAIDVGTHKVCAAIGVVGLAGGVEVLGVGYQASSGLRKGTVINTHEASPVIRRAVLQAEEMAGVRVGEAMVGVTGSHVKSRNLTTVWDHRDADAPISAAGLEEILEQSHSIPPEEGEILLHAIPRSYILDGEARIRYPVGMFVRSMRVETHLITAHRSHISNLVEAVERAGVKIQELVLEPIASSEAVTTADERELSCVLVDIGGGTSDLVIFKEGSIWYTAVIPIGGDNFTTDLSIGLKTSIQDAETFKLSHGNALPDHIREDDVYQLAYSGTDDLHEVSRLYAAQLLNDRSLDLIHYIAHHIREAGLPATPHAGVVLSGGASKLSGLLELASEHLPGPVRIGHPEGLSGRTESLRGPQYATVTGILMWAARHQRPGRWHKEGLAGFKKLFSRFTAAKEPEFTLRNPQQISTQRVPRRFHRS